MDEGTQNFIYVLAIMGWFMCCFHSYNWIREDCGWNNENTIEVNAHNIDYTDDTVIEAVVVNEI